MPVKKGAILMKLLLDMHNHTIVSGHAYSTLLEIAKEANKKGLKYIGITEHGPTMPGGPHIFHIANQKIWPKTIEGVEILKGVEANILDEKGKLDIPDVMLADLDIVLAGLHDACTESWGIEGNTNALLNTMKNKYVDVIVHPGNPAFPIDKERFVLGAKETNTLVEINNSSFVHSRKGSKEHCYEIAKLCKKHKVQVIVGSDSHIAFDVGRFDEAIELLRSIQMPEELIINTDIDRFVNYLKDKGKARFNSKD